MLAFAKTCILALSSGLVLMLGVLSPLSAQASALLEDRHAAVIFVYHSIGDDYPPGTSISFDRFQDQIKELHGGGYTVLPLPEIVGDLKNKDPLPPHTVGITFDGGDKSVLTQAAPLLIKNDIPFTIFIAPGRVDQDLPDYLNWDDVRKLARNRLVTVGMHPNDYQRIAGDKPADIAREINTAKARFREQMGFEPELFAYPFGEYSIAYRSVVEQNGFEAAFGQQSGAAWSGSDMFALPRFSLTEDYGDIDRFRMIASSLPLPVTDVSPKDPRLTTTTPYIGFTVDPRLKARLNRLSCFVSDQPPPTVHIIGDSRVEVRLKQPLIDDRVRVNCTLPVPSANGGDQKQWRWFGMLLTNAGAP